MYISQVLNNNVLLVEDKFHQEKVIWGRGIGFKKSKGQNYTLKDTDKVFSAMSKHDEIWLNSFNELSQKIPREYFELAEKIILIAKEEIDESFDDNLLIPLTDHMYFAVKRSEMGVFIANPMIFDIKRSFNKEFNIGMKAVEMLRELSGVPIKDDEAGFIAIHLVQHELSNSRVKIKNVEEFFEITKHIKKIIEVGLDCYITEDSVAVNRLMTHLNFLLLRSVNKNQKTSLTKEDALVLEMFSKSNPQLVKVVDEIVKFLEQKIEYQFNNIDKLYLMIHIAHITE